MNKNEEKKELRKNVLRIRDGISPKEREKRSLEICKLILALPEFEACETLYTFIPYRSEVDILPVLEQAWKLGKSVAAPRVKEDGIMVFHELLSMDSLEIGYKNILEPKVELPVVQPDVTQALMLVPGCAFTPDGFRMGYGKGFYDRYLCHYPDLATIGVCFKEQLVERLPIEKTDVKLGKIIYL